MKINRPYQIQTIPSIWKIKNILQTIIKIQKNQKEKNTKKITKSKMNKWMKSNNHKRKDNKAI